MDFLKVQETAEKIQKFTERKRGSLQINKILADYYGKTENNKKKANQIYNCSSYLLFRNYQNPGNTKKLVAANFCKHPLCLMCAWRLHLKKVRILHKALEMLQIDEPNIKFYFLNLTVKNWNTISKPKLRDFQNKAVRFIRDALNIKDYYCSTEISISKNEKLPYHPHIHAIVSTDEALGTMLQEINLLRQIWAKVYGEEEYDFLELTLYPIRENSVNEVTKYILKPEQKITSDKVTSIAVAIKGLKKTFSAGKIRDYIKIAKKHIERENDTEMEELEHFSFTDEFYKWLGNQYLIKSLDE